MKYNLTLLIFLFPTTAMAEITGNDVISHSVSLMTGAIACFSLILGYMISKD